MKLAHLLVAVYRTVGSFISRFAPISSILTLIGLMVALVGFTIEMEDRQSERTFRAWDYVIQNESMMRQFENDETEVLPPNINIGSALEYLNRRFDGRICGDWISMLSKWVIGNKDRDCIFPRKLRSDFSRRFFRGANLHNTRLDLAVFNRADLEISNFNGASLQESKFFRANLWGASLNNANLNEAKLKNSCLEETNFVDAELTRAKLQWSVAVRANFKNANLSGSNLRDADLRGSILRGADFSRANLSGAKLFMADVSGTNFQEAKGLTRSQVLRSCISEDQPAPKLPKEIGEVDWSDRLCSRSKVKLTKCPEHR